MLVLTYKCVYLSNILQWTTKTLKYSEISYYMYKAVKEQPKTRRWWSRGGIYGAETV